MPNKIIGRIQIFIWERQKLYHIFKEAYLKWKIEKMQSEIEEAFDA